MGGCFGPKQRKQQVYIQMIQTIHQQVTQMTFQKNENLDIYQVIKEKLSKKGLLRKLIDNLISHRNKIYDSLNHNYQIVLQSSKIQNKYAGLLIIDQIIEGIYQSLKTNHNKHSHNNDSQDFTNTNVQNNMKSDAFFQSVGQLLVEKTSPNQRSTTMIQMQSHPLIRQIDSRFDLIYFNLIIYLLENVPKMYLRILKSINSYCLHKKNKINCTQSAWQVLNLIMTKILKQIKLKQNLHSYCLLLQSTKQNFKDYQQANDLKFFIKIWMKQRFKVSTQKNFDKFGINHTQQSSSAINQVTDTQDLIINTIKIISVYFNINISTWNSPYLYDILIDVYDENQFQLSKINQFQIVIFQIVIKSDLHVHFFRGLFLVLLDYLCYKANSRGSRIGSNNYSNPQQLKWVNISKNYVKFNAIKTLRRWVNKKQIDLNQTVSYNCTLLVNSYLQNLHPLSPQQNNEICKQLLKLIRQNLNLKSKQILISTLIQNIKDSQTDSRIRTTIISILRQLLQDQNLFKPLIQQDFDYIITIDEHYSKQNQMQLVQLMGFIVQKLPEQLYFSQTSDYNSYTIINFKHRICDFLHSCFEVLIFGSADQLFKYRFSCALTSFLTQIQLKHNLSIIYAFYLELIKQLTIPTTTKHIPSKNYFILYLTYEISHILVNDIKVPTDFRILNQKISSIGVNHNHPQNQNTTKLLKQQITQLIQKIVIQNKYTEPNLIKQQFRCKYIDLEIQKSHFIVKENLESTCKILRSYFTNNLNNVNKNKNKQLLSTKSDNQQNNSNYNNSSGNYGSNSYGQKGSTITNPFGRRDSIYNQSDNGSEFRQDDKNLKDVLTIIKN